MYAMDAAAMHNPILPRIQSFVAAGTDEMGTQQQWLAYCIRTPDDTSSSMSLKFEYVFFSSARQIWCIIPYQFVVCECYI